MGAITMMTEELDEGSLGQISLVHLLTGRTGWPGRFQEGGGPGKKGKVWTREGKEEHLKIRRGIALKRSR